jgi:argininosuccinate synthase
MDPRRGLAKKPYSMDRNLLHISYEAGILEDPWFDPTTRANKAMFKLSVSPEDAPDRAGVRGARVRAGDCVAVNGRRLTPAGVLRALNKLGGKHGIGRVDLVENRFVGMKSRGVYETPGGTILMHGHRQVESLTLDREVMHLRDSLIPKYAELVYYGFWFAPEREALQALVDESQAFVSGTVRLKLYKGNIITCGRKSRYSLYDMKIASMEGVKSWYNQSDATGFIGSTACGCARATWCSAVRRPEADALAPDAPVRSREVEEHELVLLLGLREGGGVILGPFGGARRRDDEQCGCAAG